MVFRREKTGNWLYIVLAIFILVLLLLTILFSTSNLYKAYIDDRFLVDGWFESGERIYKEQLLGLEKQSTFKYKFDSITEEKYTAFLTVTSIKTIFMINEQELLDKTIKTIFNAVSTINITIINSSQFTGSRFLKNGHNSFFKGNYLFQTWTNADAIIDYLLFAKNYVAKCERRYGIEEVEAILDSCHALMNYGVDRYKRPQKLSAEEEKLRQKEREDYLQSQVNDLWRTLPIVDSVKSKRQEVRFPSEPQENILYFIEKNAPLMEPWQRELVRIVRKIAQYFYPQRQTQVMNEGWATFWHYTILNKMYDEGLLSDGFMMEFLQSHTNVTAQPSYNSPYYSGINPYALGFSMYSDIKRICEDPTDEDKYWFPEIAGSDWKKTLDFAMRNFKDESFIAQFLSPKLMREFKFFSVLDDDEKDMLEITAIHDESGYRKLRQALVNYYNLHNREPNIQIYNVNHRGDRSLTLRHTQHDRQPLGDSTEEMLKHLVRLWGFTVRLETEYENGDIDLTYECKINH